MKLFECQNCGQLLFFENTRCERCGHLLGYLSERTCLSALAPEGELWRALAAPVTLYRYCANAGQGACNWLVRADSAEQLCQSCRLNHTIPNLDSFENARRWRLLEAAKHRLVYGLQRLGLKVIDKKAEPERGLAFDFLAAPVVVTETDKAVVTGHDNGLITIDVAEADDVERERHRRNMAEPYRTLLGHFRHEV